MKQVKRTNAKKVTKKAQAKKKVEPKDKPEAAATTPEPPKVFDISKPGKSLADASSKPILVTHKAPIQDPMVNPLAAAPKGTAGADAVTVASDEKPGLRVTKTRIEPLHDTSTDTASSVPDTVSTPEESERPSAEEGVMETAQNTVESTVEEVKEAPEAEAPSTPEPPKEQESTSSDNESAEDMGDLGSDPQKAAKNAEDAAAEKRLSQAAALIDSKAYFVPINAVKNRKSLRLLLLVAIIAIVIVGGLVALDAGLVDIGIKAPTDFIPD
jgi:hypothetical protein